MKKIFILLLTTVVSMWVVAQNPLPITSDDDTIPTGDTIIKHYEMCAGMAITYNGVTYSQQGEYPIHIPSVSGKDSVVLLQLVWKDSYIFHQPTVFLCDGESYTWVGHLNDTIITEQGVYRDSLVAVGGCDSIYELKVLQSGRAYHYDSIAVCEEDLPYLFNGKNLTTSGVYYDTLRRGSSTCDSVIRLALTVLPNKIEERTVAFCEGTGASHNGSELFYEARTFTDTFLLKENGCYHIIKTIYTPGPVNELHETKYRTQDQVNFLWHGKTYTKDGTYYDRQKNMEGCDSVWVLHLITNYNLHEDRVACEGDTIFYKKEPITHDCIITDSLISHFGGDSILNIHFEFKPRYYFLERTSICSNEYIPWPGHEHIILHEAGAYYDRYTTVTGCDSIYEIDVTTHRAYSKDTFVAVSNYHAADSLPFIWYDAHNRRHELTFDTLIIDTLGHTPLKYPKDWMTSDNIWDRTLSGGCDSTVSIEFMVVRKYSFDTIPLCPNGYVVVDGHKYDKPGDYEHWLLSKPTSLHADSIHYFHIYETNLFDSKYTDRDSVCANDLPYRWHNCSCYNTGRYIDTIPSRFGCDSVVYLELVVFPDYRTDIPVTICSNETFKIHNQLITKTGTYVDSLISRTRGCDSIVYYHVNVLPSFIKDETLHLGPDSARLWREKWYDKPGVYTDSLTTIEGCDSVYRLTLLQDPIYDYYDTVSLCQSELPYTWCDSMYYLAGDYTKSYKSTYRMDSIRHLHLVVYPIYETTERVDRCAGDIYYLNGRQITHSGSYTDTLTTQNGCDSIAHTIVNFHKTYFEDDSVLFVPSVAIDWHGLHITQPGIYHDSLVSMSGCDSIFRLHVQAPTYFQRQDILLCNGTTTTVNGHVFSSSGVFTDTLKTIYGCDSVIQYIVKVYPSYHWNSTAVFCSGDAYTWHAPGGDTVITKVGTYYRRFTTINGCDSVYSLTLKALPNYRHDTVIYVCNDELPYLHEGEEYFTNKDFYDTLRTIDGCDSILITRYRLNNNCSELYHYTHCQGSILSIDGHAILHDGEYRYRIGTDSVHRFIVSSLPTYEYTRDIGTYCDSVTYAGVTYRARGAGKETFTVDRYLRTVDDCDSIEHITMTIYSSMAVAHYYQNIYDYSAILLNGQIYNETGDYTLPLHTIHGCDSTVILHLTVMPTDHSGSLLYHHCYSDTDPLTIFGKFYHPTHDTIIVDTVTLSNTGMRKISRASVTVTYPFRIVDIDAESEVCAANDISFYIQYHHQGDYPNHYELQFLNSQLSIAEPVQRGDINGRSVIPVNMDGQGLCVAPGIYPYRLTLTSDNCPMSDTVINNDIIVRYPSSVLEANWDNTVALVNEQYNIGGWRFKPPYRWKIWDVLGGDKTAIVKPDANLPYLYSDMLEPGDKIEVTLMRNGYSQPVPSCSYVFYPTYADEHVPMLVYPTAVRVAQRLTIESHTTGSYTLYTNTGLPVASGTLTDGTMNIAAPSVPGYYLIQLRTAEGAFQTKRIIVY